MHSSSNRWKYKHITLKNSYLCLDQGSSRIATNIYAWSNFNVDIRYWMKLRWKSSMEWCMLYLYAKPKTILWRYQVPKRQTKLELISLSTSVLNIVIYRKNGIRLFHSRYLNWRMGSELTNARPVVLLETFRKTIAPV